MVEKKSGWPEEGELVIATVTKIQYHSIFCNLDEYGKAGMLHISEIAPGRIKNVQDYVKEGKTLILKVLKTDADKGHIDLSLRRVTEAQKRQKSTEIKQQQIVDKILTQYAEKHKSSPEELTKQLQPLLQDYETLYDAFQAVVDEGYALPVDKKLAEELSTFITDRIKPQEVTIKGAFTITSWADQGVKVLHEAFKGRPENVNVAYAGGGRYTVVITAPDYKQAEAALKELTEQVKSILTQADVSFERTDGR